MRRDAGTEKVRLELLRPHEIERALASNSTVYFPLGTIEWHCAHLPVGLDGLTAQGVCERAASDHGGLVFPPLYFGTGGGHSAYPWTVMAPTGDPIRYLLENALGRLCDFGVRRAVLFSGHFAPEQLQLIEDIASRWNSVNSALAVVAKGINMIEDSPIAPDHAGVFETTMLSALWPDRVDLQQLAPLRLDGPLTDDVDDARHDPNHPLWGVFGPDPRTFNPESGPQLLAKAARWLASFGASPLHDGEPHG
jgi:creatinine amidohydrolase